MPGVTRRRTDPDEITTGKSAWSRPNCRRSSRRCGSRRDPAIRSGSVSATRNSRSCSTSGEYRDPMTRVAEAGSVRSTFRRAMNVARILSLRCGSVAMMRRSSSTGIDQDLAGLGDPGRARRPASRSAGSTRRGSVRPVGHDDLLFAVDVEDDLDQTRKDDVEVVARVAGPVEVLALVDQPGDARTTPAARARRRRGRERPLGRRCQPWIAFLRSESTVRDGVAEPRLRP